jgi:regulator of PEP synthase PpsR (kinase-PPPase family)
MSDGTGKTAKRLMDAVLAQYSPREVEYSLVRIFHEIQSKEAFDKILQEIDNEYLVIFSIIKEDLSRYFHDRLAEKGILNINVLEPMLETMSKFLGVHPDYRPGILQIIDDKYYKKIDAIGFTVEHDDGRGQLHQEADLVLLGVSRTCKTPISMYLACNFGLKVANIPVVRHPAMDTNLLAKLSPVHREKIIGLVMQPEVLAHVREERSHYLAGNPVSLMEIQSYYDVREIRVELAFCREIFKTHNWQTIDVTRRAIEEVSVEILGRLSFSQ